MNPLQIQDPNKIVHKRLVNKKRTWINVLLISFLLLLFPSTGRGAEGPEVHWNDYREPLSQRIRIRQNKKAPVESAKIFVNLPDKFLQHHEKIILVITIESDTRNSKTGKVNFSTFAPYIKVEDVFWGGNYNIPVNTTGQETQIQQIEIETKHLKPGINTLKASYNWKKKSKKCSVYGCGYKIHKMYFKDAPPLTYHLEISSEPSGGKVFIGGASVPYRTLKSLE